MVQIKNKFYMLSAFVALTPNAYSSNLSELFNKVVNTNPVIISSRHGVNVAREHMKQNQADFYPTVTATGSVTNSDTNFENSTDVNNHPKTIGVNFKQNIFAGGGIVSSYRSSRSSYLSTKASHNKTMQTVLNNLASAYVNVLTAKKVLKLQKNQVKLLKQQENMSNARFKHGELTKTDVKQSEARVASAIADRIQAAGSYRIAQTTLANLIGSKVTDLSWPTIDLDLPKEYTENLKNSTLNSHPDVIASLATLSSKKYNITVAKADHYPEINAVASYSQNKDTSSGDFDNRTIGLELSIPLFKGGKTLSSVRSSIESKEQAMQNYEQVKRDVIENLINAIQLYTTAIATLEAFKEGEKAAKLAEVGVDKEQLLGERTVLDLLDARQELLEARVNVTKGKGNVITQAYNLLAAMGTLNANDAN